MPTENQLFLNAVGLRYLAKSIVAKFSQPSNLELVQQYFITFSREFSFLLQSELPATMSNFLDNVIPPMEITQIATQVLYHDHAWYKNSTIPDFATACNNSSKFVASIAATGSYANRAAIQFQTLATTYMNRFVNVLYYTYLLDTDFENLVFCKPGQKDAQYSLFSGNIDEYPISWNAGEVLLPTYRTITDMQILKLLGINDQLQLKEVLNYNKTPQMRGFNVSDLVKMNLAYSEVINNVRDDSNTDKT
jgi:hypothetical protein